jgi:hypothetical protein
MNWKMIDRMGTWGRGAGHSEAYHSVRLSKRICWGWDHIHKKSGTPEGIVRLGVILYFLHQCRLGSKAGVEIRDLIGVGLLIGSVWLHNPSITLILEGHV